MVRGESLGRGEGLDVALRPGEETLAGARLGEAEPPEVELREEEEEDGVRLAGEALVLEELCESAVRWRSSSDFFLPSPGGCFSWELEREFGRVYRLLVDLDLVSPLVVLLPNRRLPPPEFADSKSFLVSLTVSGAGSSLSVTPKRTPAEGRGWEDFFVLVGCLAGLLVGCLAGLLVGCLVGLVVGCRLPWLGLDLLTTAALVLLGTAAFT